MEPAKRVLLNTFAQYTRTIINVCLSFYSTRLVLDALGKSDYGIYTLVGGVVAMLGFISGALVVTTQRHLSFSHGKGNLDEVRKVFANSLWLHLIIGLALLVILFCLGPFLFNGFLNIDAARIDVAKKVYVVVVLILLMTFLAAPFRALFIARENIIYISIVDVLDGVLKFSLVLMLAHVGSDKLMTYAWMMLTVQVFNFLVLSLYARFHYRECTLVPRLRDFDKAVMGKILGFAGWTTYSVGCILVRTQGVSVILNRFFGTIINSAYGIAMQVSGAVSFVSQSILNAMSPQIVKAEGAGNRERMLALAELTSKYSFLLLAMISIPLVFEMPSILAFWLQEVPEHTIMFCRFILIAGVCDQLTIGLGTANQAIGRIRNYSLAVNTTKVLTLPLAWLCLRQGLPVAAVMWTYLIMEIVCAIIRLPFLKYTADLSITHFAQHVFLRILAPLAALLAVCFLMVRLPEMKFRFVLTLVAAVLVTLGVMWRFACESTEREAIKEMIGKKQMKQ